MILSSTKFLTFAIYFQTNLIYFITCNTGVDAIVERQETFYKLNNFNDVTWWRISQSENKVSIQWGQRLPVGSTSQAENYEHPSIEQASQDYETRRNKQVDRRGFTPEIPTTRPDLPMLCQEYRNPPSWDTFAVQPKLDGIRCIAKDGQLYSRTNQLITSCPHIEMYLRLLPNEIKLDGELIVQNTPWVITESYVNKTYPTKECLVIEYHVFDVIDTEAPFWARSQEVELQVRKLEQWYMKFMYPTHPHQKNPWFSRKFPFKIVPTTIYDEPLDDEVVQQHFQASKDAGYEGLIVRNASVPYFPAERSSNILKLKQFFDKEFKIVDVIPNKKGEGVLVCETPNGSQFNCNFKATSAKKQQMLAFKHNYIGKLVTVEYEGIHESGRPRCPVGIKIHK